MVNVEIDSLSGCCIGVKNAIRKAEEQLDEQSFLYCLGDIVHNTIEVERLQHKGLKTITHEEMSKLKDANILFRAHGEPPSTYQTAIRNRLEIIDATCPVVLHLQKQIKKIYEETQGSDTQLLIFGKAGHAEVNGLVGQTNNTALVIEHPDQIEAIDFTRPIVLFSQTTKSQDEYKQLIEEIQKRLPENLSFEYHNTICKYFGNRMPQIRKFAAAHDCILFVSDAKSSNGRALFKACHEVNQSSYFVSGPNDVKTDWLQNKENIGICGATSTPVWLMKEVQAIIFDLLQLPR